MKVNKHIFVDVFYNESEKNEAILYGGQLKQEGYSLVSEDSGAGNYKYCDQYSKLIR